MCCCSSASFAGRERQSNPQRMIRPRFERVSRSPFSRLLRLLAAVPILSHPRYQRNPRSFRPEKMSLGNGRPLVLRITVLKNSQVSRQRSAVSIESGRSSGSPKFGVGSDLVAVNLLAKSSLQDCSAKSLIIGLREASVLPDWSSSTALKCPNAARRKQGAPGDRGHPQRKLGWNHPTGRSPHHSLEAP